MLQMLRTCGCMSLNPILGMDAYMSPNLRYNNHIAIIHKCSHNGSEVSHHCGMGNDPHWHWNLVLIICDNNFYMCRKWKINSLSTPKPFDPLALFTTSLPHTNAMKDNWNYIHARLDIMGISLRFGLHRVVIAPTRLQWLLWIWFLLMSLAL